MIPSLAERCGKVKENNGILKYHREEGNGFVWRNEVKLRILMCPEYFFPHIGGGEVWSWHVARHLVRRGHEVHILTYKHPEYWHDQVLEGIQIHRLGPFPIKGIQTYFRRALVQGLGIISEGVNTEYDIIQASQTFPLIPSYFLSKLKKRPIVAVYHDVYGFSFSLKDKGLAKGIIRGSVEKIALMQNYDAVIAVSQSTKRKLLAHDLPEDKIKVIHEGVDLRLIDSIKVETSDSPLIVYVGRLVPHKRVNDLLQAFKLVSAKIPSSRLLIVGTGQMEQKLKDYASSLGISKYTHFTGFIRESEKISIIKRAHVLVLPSVMEGFGLVLIEAMACKTPVIAVDLGGPREVVNDGETGYLIQPYNTRQLSERILTILQDTQLRLEMGRRGRLSVEKSFTWDIAANKIEQIYSKVLARDT